MSPTTTPNLPKPKLKAKPKFPLSQNEIDGLEALDANLQVLDANASNLPVDLKNHWNNTIKQKLPTLTRLFHYVKNNYVKPGK